MQFLNHPITLTFAVTLAFILPVAVLKGIKWLYTTLEETSNQEVLENQPIPEKEDFPNGCEIMLKAARGELPRTEYDEFCQQRERLRRERRAKGGENKIVENYSIQRKNRRFESPTGW